MKAISPLEARERVAQAENIPDFVIEIVNNLLSELYTGPRIRIYFEDVVKKILEHYQFQDASQLPEKWLQWMNFEPSFRAVGWDVEFRRTNSSEDGKEYYLFSERIPQT